MTHTPTKLSNDKGRLRLMVAQMHPDRSGIIEEFIAHLFVGLRGHLVAFSGRQARLEDPEARPNELTDIRQAFFPYPEGAGRACEAMAREAQAGRDAYLGVHLYARAGQRLASNAVRYVRALWLDLDNGKYPEEGPKPTYRLRSSADRWQLFWRLSRPVPISNAVDLNRRLAVWADGDVGKAGLSSVLRTPGTYNFKRLPRVDKVEGEVTGVPSWVPEVMQEAIPPLPEPKPKPRKPYDGPPGARIDLLPWLEASSVRVLAEVPDGKGRKFAIICPWVGEHSGEDRSGTYAGQYPAEDGSLNGPTWFHCNHAHCEGRGWSEFRRRVEPQLIGGRRGKSKAHRVGTKRGVRA